MDSIDIEPFRATADDDRNARSLVDRKARDSLILNAMLREGDEPEAVAVRIRNLSAGGLMAEHPTFAPRGTPVEIELRGIGKVSGRIAWATDGRVGIAFDQEIDQRDVHKTGGRRAEND